MKLVVSGASGQFGRKATQLLLERVAAEDLILVTRNPDALDEAQGQGADVRYGDFDEADLARTGLCRRRPAAADQHAQRRPSCCAAWPRHRCSKSRRNRSCRLPRPAACIPKIRRSSCPTIARPREAEGERPDFTLMRDSLYAERPCSRSCRGRSARADALGERGGQAPFVAAGLRRLGGRGAGREGHAGRIYEITGPELVSMRDLCALPRR